MNKAKVLLVGFIFLGLLAVADNKVLSRTTVNQLQCDPLDNHCVYRVLNTSLGGINKLISRASTDTFGISIPPEPNRIQPPKGSEINFEFPDQKDQDKFIRALQRYDKYDYIAANQLEVEFSYKVYALESSGYQNFEAGMTGALSKHNPGDGKLSNFILSNSNGANGAKTTGFQLNLGNLTSSLFSLFLDFSRIRYWSLQSDYAMMAITNGEDMAFSQSRQIYNPKLYGAADIVKANIGFSLTGEVNVDDSGKKVTIKNFNFNFMSPTNDESSLASSLNIPRKSVEFDLDSSYVLMQKTVQLNRNSTGNNFIFSVKNSDDAISTTLIVVLHANLKNSPGDINTNDQDTKKLELSSDSSKTVEQCLNSTVGFVEPIDNGMMKNFLFGRLMGFKLDQQTVSTQIADNYIEIKEKNLISNQVDSDIISIEKLAATGYVFKTIKYESLEKPCKTDVNHCARIPVEITMRTEDGKISSAFDMNYYPSEDKIKIIKKGVTESTPRDPKRKWFSN